MRRKEAFCPEMDEALQWSVYRVILNPFCLQTPLKLSNKEPGLAGEAAETGVTQTIYCWAVSRHRYKVCFVFYEPAWLLSKLSWSLLESDRDFVQDQFHPALGSTLQQFFFSHGAPSAITSVFIFKNKINEVPECA